MRTLCFLLPACVLPSWLLLAATLFRAQAASPADCPPHWLQAHGLTGDPAVAAAADADRDGAAAWQEYLAGTDPTNAASVLRLEAAIAPAVARLSFPAGLARRLQVESSDDLTQWSPVGAPVLGEGQTEWVLDDRSQTGEQRHYRVRVLGPSVASGMVWLPAGTFVMGSPVGEPGRNADEGPQTTVTLSRDFWVLDHEVTQREYAGLMGTNPATFAENLDWPVENVTWHDATNYCVRLTAQEHAAGRLPRGYAYRLPTEAEWEYACRAGTTTATVFGESLSSQQANFDGEHPYNWAAPGPHLGHPTVAGAYAANGWGLYDLHGNLNEWCLDWYTNVLAGGSVTDPAGPESGDVRVARSGCWDMPGSVCRSASRLNGFPDQGGEYLGFRVVLAPVPGYGLASITGTVVGQDTGEPMAGVTLHLLDADFPADTSDLAGNQRAVVGTQQTDETGQYVFAGLRPGHYLVVPLLVDSETVRGVLWDTNSAPPEVVLVNEHPVVNFVAEPPSLLEDGSTFTVDLFVTNIPAGVVETNLALSVTRESVILVFMDWSGGQQSPAIESPGIRYTTDGNRVAKYTVTYEYGRFYFWYDGHFLTWVLNNLQFELKYWKEPQSWLHWLPDGYWERQVWQSFDACPSHSVYTWSYGEKQEPRRVGDAVLAAPVALPATRLGPGQFTANWTAVPGASGYRMDVSTAADFSSFVLREQLIGAGGTTDWVVRGLTNDSPCFYRVRAHTGDQFSPSSEIVQVDMHTLAPLALPATDVVPDGFTAHWQALATAQGYRLQVSRDATFTGGLVLDVSLGAVTSHRVTGLPSGGTTYYYRVCATAGAVATVFSAPVAATFSVPGLIWIPAGTYTMGSPAGEPNRSDHEGPLTPVTLTQGFWMSAAEVTQAQFLDLMGTNPSAALRTFNDPAWPVDGVSWEQAAAYCAALTGHERLAGRLPSGWGYRLPTEAEWEYACRAGTATACSSGPTTDARWARGDTATPGKAGPDGGRLPNPWGLYDVHGNVAEWCLDWFGPYPGQAVTDPRGPATGTQRVARGGSFVLSYAYLRSAFRQPVAPEIGGALLTGHGLRTVLAPAP